MHNVFLFFTKTILAFLIEVPYEIFLLQELHIGALVINIAFHPILLFLLATTVRMPGSSNTERIIEDVQKIVTGDGTLPTLIVRQPRHYGAPTWTFFALLYVTLFLLLFWSLFSVLAVMQFSLVAMFMFVVFLGLVSFLAVRIRRSVNDIRILPARESALGALLTFLSLPVLEFGRWLTVHINQLNVALFLMDRVLEAPFKIFIDVVEEWFSFVRERREEIV
jgi:amino acid transporter